MNQVVIITMMMIIIIILLLLLLTIITIIIITRRFVEHGSSTEGKDTVREFKKLKSSYKFKNIG